MITVVIPTLNAEKTLVRTLTPLVPAVMRGLIKNVVVVDGGSTDRTAEIAEDAGVTFMSAERGRGMQLAAGADTATGDWILFLHADTHLLRGWEDEVEQFVMDPRNKRRAAAFRFALDDDAPSARWLERLVKWRCGLFRLPYGDQGLLLSRIFYKELGGFRKMPLMEDVDMVRRIGWRHIALFQSEAMTSADRYRQNGYMARPLRNLSILFLYFLGVSPERLQRLYSS